MRDSNQWDIQTVNVPAMPLLQCGRLNGRVLNIAKLLKILLEIAVYRQIQNNSSKGSCFVLDMVTIIPKL